MSDQGSRGRSTIGTVGWAIVMLGAALLVFQGVTWYFNGAETALVNIAERTPLATEEFRRGSPSAFDVITIVTRQQALYGAALGVLTLFVAWQGYRRGSRAAWWACWVFVVAVGGVGFSFTLGGGAQIGVIYLGLAGIFAAGLLMARRSLQRDSATAGSPDPATVPTAGRVEGG